jgi:oxygen-independent coproporphyrinogen-3 oxidase
VSGVRWWNIKHPTRYAAALDAGMSPAAGRETLDPAARYTEKIMLGVRMRAGLPTYELTEHARRSLPQLASWGLIDVGSMNVGQVVLTQRGRLMADAVVRELLS